MSEPRQQLPAVGRLVNTPAMRALIEQHGHEVVTYALRRTVAAARAQLATAAPPPDTGALLARATALVQAIVAPALKPVINATGVVLHTNLGRAVLGSQVLADLAPIVTGYANLEFDLDTGERGQREEHVAELLRFLTDAEDVALVNNNAAALVLILNTLAKRREIVVSRGELIEIGGSFRLPAIMRASGVRMVEVGTTNRTRLADYEQAITPKTALLFKAHRSNYEIRGFTEEVGIAELATLARRQGLPLVYDLGSGLLRRPAGLTLGGEPDVRSTLAAGADLVAFSGDKLLGGPQSGIIVGRADLVRKLAKAPLLRALRVGKLTLAALASACRSYLPGAGLETRNPTFALLERTPAELDSLAQALAQRLTATGLTVRVADSTGQAGGGTLPGLELPGRAVVVLPPAGARRGFVNTLFQSLLRLDQPVVGVRREGHLWLDVRALFAADLDYVAAAVTAAAVRAAARPPPTPAPGAPPET